MSKPLLPREICRFRIEMNEIIVWEKKLANEAVQDFIDASRSKYYRHAPDHENETQWFAQIAIPSEAPVINSVNPEVPFTEWRTIAYAHLSGAGPEVSFGFIVHPDFRSQGLGTVMLRMAHDMAIRHHKSVINVEIDEGNFRSYKTFEREGFDFTPPEDDPTAAHGKIVRGRKEIR